MIFADTSALFALFNPGDEYHNAAKEWFKNQRPKLILTDYIVDELLALAISRGNKAAMWIDVVPNNGFAIAT